VPDVRVLPFDEIIACEEDETVLAAALRNGRFLRYGCKGGGCGTCKLQIVDGAVEEAHLSFALSASERDAGIFLACASVPLEDCVIDVSAMELTEEEFRAGDTTASYDTVLESLEPLTHDIRYLRLRLCDPPAMPFVAGQFVNVEAPGTGASRSYSMANPPGDADVIELIVKILPDGVFSGYLEREARTGDHIRVEGPFGTLKIRLSHRRILMIAGGSGMAPLLAMLSDLAAKGNQRPVTFFFGARTERDLYCLDRIERLAERMAVDFVPVLSESWSDSWAGETGFVTDAVARRFPSLEGFDAYLCGPPPMIDAARPLLIARGVRVRNIYFDAFAPSGSTPVGEGVA
jgi:NAD(P)H-flavin reductase/ferredoxin